MRRKKITGVIALIVTGFIFGAVLVSGFGWVRPGLAEVIIGAKNPPVTNVDVNAFSKAFTDVAEKVTPSIVQIAVASETKKNPHEDIPFFFPFKDNVPKEQLGSGSGVIISEDGYILTNNHVVENATKVNVTLFDKRAFEAKVIGTDPQTDIAIIKIDASGLPAAYLGNSDNVKVGQWVMAIGNPLSLASTVTAGIVSAKGRNIGILRNKDNSGIEDFIQTDAVINPGNSGGALVDLSGSVIGINSAIATGMTGSYIGYGFAIPINMAKNISKELIATGKVNRGYIGVNIGEVDPVTAKAVGLDKARGIFVQGLRKGGAAEKADIKEGDIILKIDGRELEKSGQLQSYVASKSAGDKVVLLLFRDGKEIERTVTLKSLDVSAAVEPVSDAKDESGRSKKGFGSSLTFDNVGMTVKNLSDEEKEKFNVESGIYIADVKTLSRAYDQGLRSGLIITQADRKSISSVDDFDKIMKNKKGGAVLLKLVDGQGNARFVGLEIPE
ncbi:MAG: Do family serine endopeptidase [Ignavibacteria bacterium]